MISIGLVCRILGISLSTAYRWLQRGVIQEAYRTVGNHRRFDEAAIHRLLRSASLPRVMTYARVSSHDQRDDLPRQSDVLRRYAIEQGFSTITAIEDIGSGLNTKKKGLTKLLDAIFQRQVDVIIVNHRDRLWRFGVDLVDMICKHHGVRRMVVESNVLPFEEQWSRDVIEWRTVFCAKLYGKRSHS
jgi:putative resolvase